jgi:hypothetical protein
MCFCVLKRDINGFLLGFDYHQPKAFPKINIIKMTNNMAIRYVLPFFPFIFHLINFFPNSF